MQRYVALLRGINVGGNSKVEMSKLKKVFESLRFTEVSTYINSGNVIFSAPKKQPKLLARTIERALEKAFRFPIKVLVRDVKSIQKLTKAIPKQWQNNAEMRTEIFFLWDEFDKKSTLKEISVNTDVDCLVYIHGAIVWNLLRKNYTKSRMHKLIGTKVYKHMTARNVNTLRKLAERMQ
jgi:uncharacterized protein (DUF1697 family)